MVLNWVQNAYDFSLTNIASIFHITTNSFVWTQYMDMLHMIPLQIIVLMQKLVKIFCCCWALLQLMNKTLSRAFSLVSVCVVRGPGRWCTVHVIWLCLALARFKPNMHHFVRWFFAMIPRGKNVQAKDKSHAKHFPQRPFSKVIFHSS